MRLWVLFERMISAWLGASCPLLSVTSPLSSAVTYVTVHVSSIWRSRAISPVVTLTATRIHLPVTLKYWVLTAGAANSSSLKHVCFIMPESKNFRRPKPAYVGSNGFEETGPVKANLGNTSRLVEEARRRRLAEWTIMYKGSHFPRFVPLKAGYLFKFHA